MKDERTDLLNAYLEKLFSVGSSDGVALLKKIEKIGKDIPGTAKRLIPFLDHPDYLVRSRIFIVLGRIKDVEVSGQLLDYIEHEPEEEWQLRVLECLYQLNDITTVPRLSLLLEKHHEPLLIRGVTWLLGYLGGEEAMEVLLKFAESPQGRIVKSEIIYEGLALALKSLNQGNEYWADLISKNPSIARFFLYSKLPEVDKPRFSVYPYPDYLLDKAKAQGIKGKEFKKLYHWEREA